MWHFYWYIIMFVKFVNTISASWTPQKLHPSYRFPVSLVIVPTEGTASLTFLEWKWIYFLSEISTSYLDTYIYDYTMCGQIQPTNQPIKTCQYFSTQIITILIIEGLKYTLGFKKKHGSHFSWFGYILLPQT